MIFFTLQRTQVLCSALPCVCHSSSETFKGMFTKQLWWVLQSMSHASVSTYPLKQLKVCSPGSNGGYSMHLSLLTFLDSYELKVCSPGSSGGYYLLKQLKVCSPGSCGGTTVMHLSLVTQWKVCSLESAGASSYTLKAMFTGKHCACHLAAWTVKGTSTGEHWYACAYFSHSPSFNSSVLTITSLHTHGHDILTKYFFVFCLGASYDRLHEF